MSSGTNFPNGSFETTYAWNGSVWATFSFSNWTVFQGVGTTAQCANDFYAVLEQSQQTVTLPLGQFQYQNDSFEPDTLVLNQSSQNLSSIGPIVFFNRYYEPTGTVSTCGTGPQVVHSFATYLNVTVPFRFEGSNQQVSAKVPVNNSYQYVFPPNAGSWSYDNLSASGGPGGGWAFTYLGLC